MRLQIGLAKGLMHVCGLFALGISAASAAQWCSGLLEGVYMQSDGSVFIEGAWRNDWTEICNDQGTFGGIDGTTCLAWYGAAVKSETGQTKVMVFYPNDGGYTCANMPTYAFALTPGYVMVAQP